MNTNPNHPRVGVGVIVVREGQVLVGRRKNSHGHGKWAFPGGHLEWNESFEECAARELMEEAGLRAESMEFVSATNDIMPEDEKHYITVFMLAKGGMGNPEVREPDKTRSWEWFDWVDLPEPRFLPIDNLIASGYHPEECVRYQKLVRDKIPEIIQQNGEKPETHVANDEEYRSRLRDKLSEEVAEFLEGDDEKELADVLEVVRAIAKEKGMTVEQLEAARKEKYECRGGFEDRVVLDDVK